MKDHTNRQQRIENEVRLTLGSLRDVEDIDAGPYFYSRIQHQLTSTENTAGYWLARLLFGSRLAPAVLAFVLVLNVATAWMVLRTEEESQTGYRQQIIEEMASEYSLDPTTLLSDAETE